MGAALVAISAPVYWLGLVSLYLFSKDLGKFPIFEGRAPIRTRQHLQRPAARDPGPDPPWFVLAASFAAIYARFLRGNLLERVRGLHPHREGQGPEGAAVVFKHGVRSAITPIVTILGLDLGILLGGAILTETVFNIPGIGRLAFDAIQKSDLTSGHGAHGRALHHLSQPGRGRRLRVPRPPGEVLASCPFSKSRI